jgi:putative (di)nucleoside polyphosphate hydrolase
MDCLMANYRPNVAAILQKPGGEILVAERSDVAGGWQFPQGGVDDGEDLLTALERELGEEAGLKREHYEIEASRGGYRYDYPKNHRKKTAYAGTDADICLDGSHEFSRFQWIQPRAFRREWLPEFKRKVYAQVMQDFFGVKLGE